MFEISKMENCYGIKKLNINYGTEFKKINLLFAPNGTFKTSFFNTLKEYSLGNIVGVTDRLTGEQAEVHILCNGSKLKEEDIILFDKKIVSEIDKMKSLRLITDKKVLSKFNNLQMFLNNFSNIENTDSSGNKFQYLLKLMDISKSNDFLKYKENFEMYLKENKLENFSEAYFKNSKLFEEEIQKNISTVIEVEKKSLDIIKENFGIKDIDNAMNFIDKLYRAGHAISINVSNDNQLYIENFEKFKELFEKEKKELQLSIKKDNNEFSNIIKTLDNNVKNRKIKQSISNQISNLELFEKKEEYLTLFYNYKKFETININEIRESYKVDSLKYIRYETL